jgi:AmmeMemoRadiSam system protein A
MEVLKMGIVSCYLMPHPPIMLEEVGGKEVNKVKNTVKAAIHVGKEIKQLKPDTVIVISPHGPILQDAVCLYDFPLKGNFASFGAREVSMKFDPDDQLKDKIIKTASLKGLSAVKSSDVRLSMYGIKETLDWGVMVPLYFVSQYTSNFKLLPMAFGMIPYRDLYDFGTAIRDAVDKLDKRVVVIASGDLSHRLTEEAPAGYSPEGKIFDETLVRCLREFNIEGVASIKQDIIEKAGECGLRSIWMMMGTLEGFDVKSDVLSYEGPFGVGYCVSKFVPCESSKGRIEQLDKSSDKNSEQAAEKCEDPYVKLARQTLEGYVKHGIIPGLPDDLPEEMLRERTGVFVSIKKHGQLRGCIGTIMPTRKNVAEEIRRNSISAGCEDPRFTPVREEELPLLTYSVDILTKPEPVSSKKELDPEKYGVIVRSGYKTGLLLPDLEGVNTVDEQISIALGKAGIDRFESYSIERFRVIRHS